ncbi:MAG TPA: carboxypeptidase-like regulatory domain-containing protein [Polyangiaceae bacterium]|nr:carboxypeptidase-like regulatory domain-containing protein [Polyangiaceae bacterium]
MRRRSSWFAGWFMVSGAALAAAAGCGSRDGLGDGSSSGALASCPDGTDTTVSGFVYDPAGKVPLFNAQVYVPDGPLAPIATGASCAPLGGAMLTSAVTDSSGHFTLPNMPVGNDIPVVIQVGKWQRQITVNVPPAAACTDTPLTDPNLTRLPRNRAEGNIPLMALSTGGGDTLECLLRRMGVSDSEFSTKGGPGRIHMYKGKDGPNQTSLATGQFAPNLAGGAAFPASTTLWDSVQDLDAYDAVILSCESVENADTKPANSLQALYDYEKAGGRVFASHFHRYWISHGPAPLPSIATWAATDDAPAQQTAHVDSTFPNGLAFQQWLQNVGAIPSDGTGNLNLVGRNSLLSVAAPAQRWMYVPQSTDENGDTIKSSVQLMSYRAPLGAPLAQTCGRVAFSQIHVPGTGLRSDNVGRAKPFPTGCETGDLLPHEKALEFMLLYAQSQ